METKIQYFVFLTVFYLVVVTFFGYYANDQYAIVQKDYGDDIGFGNVVVKSISGIPAWLSITFTVTTGVYVYIIITSLTPGGG